MTAATAQAVTCPPWCQESHTEEDVRRAGYVAHCAANAVGPATSESGAVLEWAVGIAGVDDEWAGIFTEAVDGMTSGQARAMAQALLEAADALEAVVPR